MKKVSKQFESLIETKATDIEIPDYVWLSYSVCAAEKSSCGWGGWIIEGAFRKTGEKLPTGTGDKLLPADYRQICPRCGEILFRTEVSIKCHPEISKTQPA